MNNLTAVCDTAIARCHAPCARCRHLDEVAIPIDVTHDLELVGERTARR
jgi:hypothetical protein